MPSRTQFVFRSKTKREGFKSNFDVYIYFQKASILINPQLILIDSTGPLGWAPGICARPPCRVAAICCKQKNRATASTALLTPVSFFPTRDTPRPFKH